jgi:hypothetical protein
MVQQMSFAGARLAMHGQAKGRPGERRLQPSESRLVAGSREEFVRRIGLVGWKWQCELRRAGHAPLCGGSPSDETKVFFFEKKKQKTFTNASGARLKH